MCKAIHKIILVPQVVDVFEELYEFVLDHTRQTKLLEKRIVDQIVQWLIDLVVLPVPREKILNEWLQELNHLGLHVLGLVEGFFKARGGVILNQQVVRHLTISIGFGLSGLPLRHNQLYYGSSR